MIYVMSKPRGLKVKRYADIMIDLNEYSDVSPGAKAIENNCETELNEILLNSIPNSCSRQAYLQGFYC